MARQRETRETCNSHAWKEQPRKPGTFACTSCPALFPCKEKDCGHGDCADVARRICFHCRRPVDAGASDRIVVRGRFKAVHPSCATRGRMTSPADAGAPALELSLCPLCYSTLSRELWPLGAGRRD
jgi:hypothetical protein